MPFTDPAQLGGRNVAAFLDMLSYSEGTDNGLQPTRNRGYDVLVGGGLFVSYTDHPRILVDLPRLGVKSTAAGRYQHLARWYDAYRRLLRLTDFGPAAQDAIAVQQIRERGALADIQAGRLAVAIDKCRNIWASLPGAGYGQHEHKLETLRTQYLRCGGQEGVA
ncbi:glycoside hydrolase family protein [Ralstonia pseudosolanacearum]|uniref:glycoside hydrolase family 24 protein n=1 Tax=Ralstonia pseudosolanacearum TaxID=1310165 RepID=UPI0027111A7D|nr:glycoside hydrolase family protein [Ralstonia pseudosolanacearum]MDO3616624.1 glycoside hydrolase family protein [Ralstonia pseudosolanacearum]